MQYNFEASGVVMRIHSLCFFPFERFVNDDTVRGIMSLFEEHYGANGRNLFIRRLCWKLGEGIWNRRGNLAQSGSGRWSA